MPLLNKLAPITDEATMRSTINWDEQVKRMVRSGKPVEMPSSADIDMQLYRSAEKAGYSLIITIDLRSPHKMQISLQKKEENRPEEVFSQEVQTDNTENIIGIKKKSVSRPSEELSLEEKRYWLNVLDRFAKSLIKDRRFLQLLEKLSNPSISDDEKQKIFKSARIYPRWDENKEMEMSNYHKFYYYMAILLALGNSVSDAFFDFLNREYNRVYNQALKHGLRESILDLPANQKEIRKQLQMD